MPGVYLVNYNNFTGEYKLRRLRCTAFTEYGDSLTDISDVVAKDGNVWALGTGTRANKLYKLNENDVSDILTTINLDPLGLPAYQTRKLSLTDDGLFLTARAFVPSYISFGTSGTSGVFSSIGPPTYNSGGAVDSQEIDVRVHCQKDDWSTSGWLVSRKSGGGSSITTASPYWIQNVNGEMRFVVRAGGTSVVAAELTSNLGCVNGQYRWLRFTYNNRNYGGDNPNAEWRMRFWHSGDGVSWTMQSYVQHSPGGALPATATRLLIGYEISLSGSGWNGDIASVLIYDESDALIHDLSLSSVDTWSATTFWQASSTLGWWGTESGRRIQGPVYVTQRRDPSTGAVLWTQVGTKQAGIHTPLSVESDGSHAYVLSTGARSDPDAVVVAPAIVKVNLSDGSEVARYTHTSGTEGRDFTLMSGDLYMTVRFNTLVKVAASSMAFVASGTVGSECTVIDNDNTHLFVSCPGPSFQNFAKVDSSLVTLLSVFVSNFGGVTQIVIPKNASGNFVERMYNAQSSSVSVVYERARSNLSTLGSNSAVYQNESPRALAVLYKASEWNVGTINW